MNENNLMITITIIYLSYSIAVQGGTNDDSVRYTQQQLIEMMNI